MLNSAMKSKNLNLFKSFLYLHYCIFLFFFANSAVSSDKRFIPTGNFGLPGIIDLPTGESPNDGDLVFTQQIHKSLARSGFTFRFTSPVFLFDTVAMALEEILVVA